MSGTTGSSVFDQVGVRDLHPEGRSMQLVGLQLPGRPGTAGWWDRGTASIPGPGVPPRRKTIQLLHSSEAPTGSKEEKGPFCFHGIRRSPGDCYGPDKQLSRRPDHTHAL